MTFAIVQVKDSEVEQWVDGCEKECGLESIGLAGCREWGIGKNRDDSQASKVSQMK